MVYAIGLLSLLLFVAGPVGANEYKVGAARVDITPTDRVRLSGYGNRTQPYEGIDHPIFVRSLALRDEDGRLLVWSSVELLGMSPAMRDAVLAKVADLGLEPACFTFAATHSHTSPHVAGVADNIFAPRMDASEIERTRVYTDWVVEKTAESIRAAVERLSPATLEVGWGSASFAANRRAIENGKWVGFGVQKDGPIDHRVGVIRVKDLRGSIRAVVYNYACHATTLDGNHNRVSGDWPGFSASAIEQKMPECIAIPMIGCGADANPEPRGSLEFSKQHGEEMTRAVSATLDGPMQPITGKPTASYAFVGLPSDRPNQLELAARRADDNLHIRQHAENMLGILERKDRLPETYPAPIQVVRFGDSLTMIFLGGEVVVDYANRLRKELAGRGDSLWVTSYANDVYGYLASERVLGEGGYEFDYWAYLYNQPGPWSAGTEEIVIRRVLDVVNNPIGEGNLDPEASLRSIRVADGLEVELVACEPAIADPVNIAFGPDGKLWVAEMGDYPLGEDNAGGAGGRVRYLQDRDGDGRFETSTLFLDGLHFATGVHPWRDGVIVSAPPEVFYVPVDTKTGKAGPKEAILDGFAKGNPQHVVNGFCVGLDNWIYINGDETGVIRSVKKGYSLNMSGRDARFLPASGEFQIECGMTQHLRSRNDAGDWFGGANYCPFWHYVLEEQYLKRNPYVVTPRPWHDVYGGFYPQVFPAGRIVDRFNDLFTAGRFTSACSPMPYRDELLGEGSHETIFACEPVHNLVHRARLVPDGLSFRAERFSADAESEFFASRDPWSRPVRVVTGPDGAVWIVDMYRQVIEHPTWIPEAWLARLDVRAGSDKGRIYRVYPKGKRPATAIPQLAGRSTRELVTLLGSSNGWTRDTAQQLLVEVQRADATEDLQKVVRSHDKPMARLHALGTLDGLGELKPDLLLTALDDPNPAVRRFAVRLSDRDLDGQLRLAARVGLAAEDPDARVRFQAAFVLGGWKDEIAADALGRIAVKDGTDPWFRVAILSSAIHHPERVLRAALAGDDSQDRSALIDGLLATSVGFQGDAGIGKIVEQILPLREKSAESWQFQALGSLMDALDRRGMRLEGWIEKADPGLADRLIALESAARRAALDDSEEMDRRTSAVGVLGRASAEREQDRQRLESLLLPTIPLEVQRAAVRVLGKLKDGEIPGLLLAGWASHSPTVRTDVLSVLMSRPEWITPLLDAIESGRVRSSELSAATQQELTNHPTSAVAERSQKLLQTGESDRREVFDRYQSVLSMTGDAGRGRDLFSRHCSACHRFGGVGQLVGPDLGGVRDRSPAGILTAVLDPNRAVESKYTGYTVVMLDGRVLSGMLLVEGSSSITLARPDGKADKLLRVDIDTMTGTGKSFMPEGLEKDVSPEALADIIAFLAQSPEDVSGK